MILNYSPGLVTLLHLITLATTSSVRPTPLNQRGIDHPTRQSTTLIHTPSSHLASRALLTSNPNSDDPKWDDKFLLSFTAHDTPFLLSLRPATNILHPDGIKVVETETKADGTRKTTESVFGRHESRIYEGWSVRSDAEFDLEKWTREEAAGVKREENEGEGGREGGRLGWARITLLDKEEGDEGLNFQGAFSIGDEVFTAHSTSNYLRTREELDPEPPLLAKRSSSGSGEILYDHPKTLIVRERATLTPFEHVEALRKRGVPLPPIDSLPPPSPSSSFCSHDTLEFNTAPSHPVWFQAAQLNLDALSSPALYSFGLFSRSSSLATPAYPPVLGKRSDISVSGGANGSSNFANVIGSTAGCPKTARVVFVGVAADCTYTSAYGSAAQARTQILSDFNSASALYSRSFNVSLGIIELNVQSGSCPSTSSQIDPANPWNVGCQGGSTGAPSLDLSSRLSTFSAWRGTRSRDGAGLWHLLTACSSGAEVGVAWLGTVCETQASSNNGQTASGTGVTSITRTQWQVIAHEIGHNFGAIHDCASASCNSCCPLSTTSCNANANFIMSPVSVNNVTTFSPCSIGNVCSSLSGSLNTTCLATPGASGNPALISIKQCGNGIVEAGEDCDPGGANDRCCDAATCKFAAGAVCDPANSLCCTSQCQLASSGTVCRASVDATCDTAETCSGTDATCPVDAFASDGTSCGNNGLTCASGVCSSRDLQCQTAGASLGLNRACAVQTSSSCAIACADPRSSRDCIVLEQSFRDGTSCGYAGTCQNGACNTSGNALDVAKSWYTSNLNIAIPVTIVVGVIILVILYYMIRCCCFSRRSKAPPSSRYAPGASSNTNNNNNNNNYPTPQPQWTTRPQSQFVPQQQQQQQQQRHPLYAPPPPVYYAPPNGRPPY